MIPTGGDNPGPEEKKYKEWVKRQQKKSMVRVDVQFIPGTDQSYKDQDPEVFYAELNRSHENQEGDESKD